MIDDFDISRLKDARNIVEAVVSYNLGCLSQDKPVVARLESIVRKLDYAIRLAEDQKA